MSYKNIQDISAKKPNTSRLIPVSFGKTIQFNSGIKRVVICLCVCGKRVEIPLSSFISGTVSSCGCKKVDFQRTRRESIESMNNRLPQKSKLTIVSYDVNRKGNIVKNGLIVMCNCGEVKVINKVSVLNGKSLSCGCYRSELHLKRCKKWEYPDRKLLTCYWDMIKRCYKPNANNYERYGGRGVTVCKTWRCNPQKFFDWAVKNGWKEGLQLDKDILGNGMLYSPKTCCFVTAKENSLHRRNSITK